MLLNTIWPPANDLMIRRSLCFLLLLWGCAAQTSPKPGVQLFSFGRNAYPNLPDDCYNAIASNVTCDPALVELSSSTDYPLEFLDRMCTDACSASLAAQKMDIRKRCRVSLLVDQVTMEAWAPWKYTEEAWYQWNQTCYKSGGLYCNLYFQDPSGVSKVQDAVRQKKDESRRNAKVRRERKSRWANSVRTTEQGEGEGQIPDVLSASMSNLLDLSNMTYGKSGRFSLGSIKPADWLLEGVSPAVDLQGRDTSNIHSRADDNHDCSDCNLRYIQWQANSAVTNYGEDLLDNLTSSCSAPGYPYISPTPLQLNTSTAAAPTGTPSPGSDSARPYKIASGDNCDNVSTRFKIPTFALMQRNNLWSIGHAQGIDNVCNQLPTGINICLPPSCDSLYKLKAGDFCGDIAYNAKISVAQLRSWNPNINPLCNNLDRYAGYYVCVSPPGGGGGDTGGSTTTTTTGDTATTTNTTTSDFSYPPYKPTVELTTLTATRLTIDPSASTTKTNVGAAAKPTAPGTNLGCKQLQAPPNNSTDCWSFADVWEVGRKEFIEWNPSLSNSGSGSNNNKAPGKYPCTVNLAFRYCVSTFGYTSTSTMATQTLPGPPSRITLLPGERPPPLPTGRGTAKPCNRWHPIDKKDTCDSIRAMYGITSGQMTAWNPVLQVDSSGKCDVNVGTLDVRKDIGYALCVGVPRRGEPAYPLPNGAWQNGITPYCWVYYTVKKGGMSECQAITQQYGISLSQLISLNPAIKSDCSRLLPNFQVCVSQKQPGSAGSASSSSSNSAKDSLSVQASVITSDSVQQNKAAVATAASTAKVQVGNSSGPSPASSAAASQSSN